MVVIIDSRWGLDCRFDVAAIIKLFEHYVDLYLSFLYSAISPPYHTDLAPPFPPPLTLHPPCPLLTSTSAALLALRFMIPALPDTSIPYSIKFPLCLYFNSPTHDIPASFLHFMY